MTIEGIPAAAAAAPAPAAAAPAAAAPAAAAPAADPSRASGAPAPAAAVAAPPASPDYAWAGDDAAQARAKAKGWATPADAIKSYGELETLLGGDKIPLPKAPDDKAGWERVHKALGRPDAPEGYGLKPAENATETDKNFQKVVSSAFFDAGIGATQAQKIIEAYDKFGAEQEAAETTARDERIDTEIGAVQKDWGHNFNQNAEVARRGFDAAGLSKEQVDAIEEHPLLGHKFVMNLGLKIGQAAAEGRFHNPNGGSNGFNPVTKESAQIRLQEIKDSPTLRTQALTAGSDINKEVDRLDKIIAGVRPD